MKNHDNSIGLRKLFIENPKAQSIFYELLVRKKKPKTLDKEVKSKLFPGEDRRKSFKTLAREELEKLGILTPKKILKNKKK
jgi:hypothetical protein